MVNVFIACQIMWWRTENVQLQRKVATPRHSSLWSEAEGPFECVCYLLLNRKVASKTLVALKDVFLFIWRNLWAGCSLLETCDLITSAGGVVLPIALPARGWRPYLHQLLGMTGVLFHPQRKLRVFLHSWKERNQRRKVRECQVKNLPVKIPSPWRDMDHAKGKTQGGLDAGEDQEGRGERM